jgi:hypothetical protein
MHNGYNKTTITTFNNSNITIPGNFSGIFTVNFTGTFTGTKTVSSVVSSLTNAADTHIGNLTGFDFSSGTSTGAYTATITESATTSYNGVFTGTIIVNLTGYENKTEWIARPNITCYPCKTNCAACEMINWDGAEVCRICKPLLKNTTDNSLIPNGCNETHTCPSDYYN